MNILQEQKQTKTSTKYLDNVKIYFPFNLTILAHIIMRMN